MDADFKEVAPALIRAELDPLWARFGVSVLENTPRRRVFPECHFFPENDFVSLSRSPPGPLDLTAGTSGPTC
jgi:hypothetical protein